MRLTPWLFVTATLAVLPGTPDLSGTYVLDKSRSDDPRKALEQATESMRRFRRNAVRKRMGDGLKPADTLQVSLAGDTVALSTSGRLHLTTVPGDPPKTREGENGRSAQLSSSWVGDTLVVKTSADRFQREARYYQVDDGGAIKVAITMSAGGNGTPMHYTLEYRRVES